MDIPGRKVPKVLRSFGTTSAHGFFQVICLDLLATGGVVEQRDLWSFADAAMKHVSR